MKRISHNGTEGCFPFCLINERERRQPAPSTAGLAAALRHTYLQQWTSACDYRCGGGRWVGRGREPGVGGGRETGTCDLDVLTAQETTDYSHSRPPFRTTGADFAAGSSSLPLSLQVTPTFLHIGLMGSLGRHICSINSSLSIEVFLIQ
jgi:hypothetical protein